MVTCARCRTANPSAARFCMGCGTGLSTPGPGPVADGLRFVTVAFCDIVGSTVLAQRFDPQVWSAILDAYFARVGGALARAGGRLEKFIGDAVVGVFGADEAGDDDALHAVRGALAALASLRDPIDDALARNDLDLGIRFGVASGRVAVARRDSSFAIGAVMNRAARLQAAAPADGTAVDLRTWLLVRDHVAGTALPPVAAKGFDRPLQAWAVGADPGPGAADPTRADPTRADPTGSALIGRDDVLAELRDAVRSAAGPTIVGLVGELGAGKTHLLRHLVARCPDHYPVWIEGGGEADLLWRLEQLERHLAAGLGGSRAAGSPSIVDLQFRVRGHLAELSRRGPVLVIVDDYDRAAPPLRELVTRDLVAPGPVAVVLAGRQVSLPTGPMIELPPLSDESARQLLTAAGLDPRLSWEPLVRRGRGNPLFLQQLAALAADGVTDEVPPSAEAALGARIDRLAAPTRAVLAGLGAWASASVSEPRAGDIDAVCDLDEATLDGCVAELTSLGLAGNRIAAEVAYAHLNLTDRAHVHAAIARRLQEYASTEPELLEVAVAHADRAHRARHELHPGSADEHEAAWLSAQCLVGAARHAVGRSEVTHAADLAGRARQIGPADPGLRLEIAALESYALGASGQVAAALEVIAAVDALAGNPSARVHLTVNRVALGGADVAAAATDPAAGEGGGVDDPGATARLETLRGLHAARDGDYAGAEALLRRAHGRVATMTGGLGVAEIYGNLALYLAFGDTPVAEATAFCLRLRERVERAATLHAVVTCPTALLVGRGGDPDEALRMLDQARSVFAGTGHSAGEAGAFEFASLVAEYAGDLAGARDAVERAGRVHARSGVVASAAECALRAYVLDPDTAEPIAAVAAARPDGWATRVLLHQVAALATGSAVELDRARAELDRVRGAGAVLGPRAACERIADRLGALTR